MDPTDKVPLLRCYQSIVGSLVWLSTQTRPDISTAVTLLAKHLANPSQGHIKAGQHIIQYLKSSASWGIHYTQPDPTAHDIMEDLLRGEVA